MNLSPQKLTYDQIDDSSLTFMNGFSDMEAIPLDIHSILEFDLKYKILPFTGLEEATLAVGFTSILDKTIYVDSKVYDHPNENRFRYTLAHEAGHIHLHKQIFIEAEKAEIRTIDDYKSFISYIADDSHSWLEYQAYSFAGSLLVPKKELLKEVESKRIELALNNMDNNPKAEAAFLRYLAQKFAVSQDCMRRRLKGLKKNLL